MKAPPRFTFWFLSFAFHALALVSAGLLSIVIEMPGDGERDFVLLVSPVEPSEWVWFDRSSQSGEVPDNKSSVQNGITGPDRSVPDLWDSSDYIIPDGTEDDPSELHTTYFIRNIRSRDCTFKEPWPSTDEKVAEVQRRGKAAYRGRCVICH